jgi:hypothetical protein
MKEHLGEILFGSREIQDASTTTLKKEKTPTKINETDLGFTKPSARRTIGLTEQRLRAANQ